LLCVKKSHEEIEALFREVLSLQYSDAENWCCWNNIEKDAKVYAGLFVSLQDKPERCGSIFLTLGSGAFGARRRHSCNYNAISHVLPSRHSCYMTNTHAITIGSLSNDTIPVELQHHMNAKSDVLYL
jgi:hypothetical protein